MRVLHLFSNYRWTGPAEPALNLCLALRAQGVEADFACAPGPPRVLNKIVETARDNDLEPLLDLHLSKHRRLFHDWRDRRALPGLLGRGGYELVHCHLNNDHRIASGPAARAGLPLVRSSYEGTGFPRTAACARLLSRSARIIEPSQMAARHDATAFGLPPERLQVIVPAVDVERFDPAREVPDGRRWLGIPPEAFVVGLVARMQTHRRYEDFFEAVRRLVAGGVRVHAVVVGRGTKQEQVARTPVRALGLEHCVHFPGYLSGDDYVGMLKAFDAQVYLVPGTDGTCRAVREAMALARPVVVADRGMLRELVEHGRTGLVCDGTAEGLHAALRRLAGNRQEARALGRAAREVAVRAYAPEVQARAVAAVYEAVLRERGQAAAARP